MSPQCPNLIAVSLIESRLDDAMIGIPNKGTLMKSTSVLRLIGRISLLQIVPISLTPATSGKTIPFPTPLLRLLGERRQTEWMVNSWDPYCFLGSYGLRKSKLIFFEFRESITTSSVSMMFISELHI